MSVVLPVDETGFAKRLSCVKVTQRDMRARSLPVNAGRAAPRQTKTKKEIDMISRIHSTTIVVADQEAALDFYVNTLGWEKAIDNQMGPDMLISTTMSL
jgi:hypothetical protein